MEKAYLNNNEISELTSISDSLVGNGRTIRQNKLVVLKWFGLRFFNGRRPYSIKKISISEYEVHMYPPKV